MFSTFGVDTYMCGVVGLFPFVAPYLFFLDLLSQSVPGRTVLVECSLVVRICLFEGFFVYVLGRLLCVVANLLQGFFGNDRCVNFFLKALDKSF